MDCFTQPGFGDHHHLCHLPSDVLVKIMSSLPLVKLYQLRLISKPWNELLKSAHVWQEWSKHQKTITRGASVPKSVWLLMARWLDAGHKSREFMVYSYDSSSTAGKWIALQNFLRCPYSDEHHEVISNIVESGDAGLPCIVSNQVSSLHTCLIAGNGNLLCFVARLENSYSFILYNMSTMESQSIPPPPDFHGETWDTVVKVVDDDAIGGYRIILMKSLYSEVYVYQSATQAWLKGKGLSIFGLPLDKIADLDTICKAHVLHVDASNKTDHIFAYNSEADAWSKLTVAIPKQAYSQHHFYTKYQERLYLVSPLKTEETDSLKGSCIAPFHNGFGVWELQASPSTSMLPSLQYVGSSDRLDQACECPSFHNSSASLEQKKQCSYDLKFMASGNIICITCVLQVDKEKYMSPLVYDISNNSWQQLPSHNGCTDFLGVCALSPPFKILE